MCAVILGQPLRHGTRKIRACCRNVGTPSSDMIPSICFPSGRQSTQSIPRHRSNSVVFNNNLTPFYNEKIPESSGESMFCGDSTFKCKNLIISLFNNSHTFYTKKQLQSPSKNSLHYCQLKSEL